MKHKDKKAVVLLSGGQDSTTALYWAIKTFGEVFAIGFDYGQTHRVELDFARQIANKAGVPFVVKVCQDLFAPSSLTTNGDHDHTSKINDELPASFTAGRNLLFVTIAASFATEVGANDIVTGVCETDFSGYPDCRNITMQSLATTLTLGMGYGDFHIHNPLMYLTKAETWRLAEGLGITDIVIKDTLTDYNGDTTLNYWGRGRLDNPASRLRKKGFDEAIQLGYIKQPKYV